MIQIRSHLSAGDIEAFGAEAKVGILATVNPEGLPHISLLTSLRAKDDAHLTFGQFCAGQSKLNVEQNPHCGFVVMGLDRRLWRGTASWTGKRTEGDDYILYNNQALFRYNAYTGFHTIHYLDLMEVSGPTPLSLPRLITGALKTRVSATFRRGDDTEQKLKPWAAGLLGKLDSLKFISAVGDDGFPRIIPVVPSYPANSGELVLNGGTELARIPDDRPVALFAMSLAMESVLVRGRLIDRRGSGMAVLAIDWVYNTMLPVVGQVYPMPPLEPVRDFESRGEVRG